MTTKLSVRTALAFTTIAVILVGMYRWVRRTLLKAKKVKPMYLSDSQIAQLLGIDEARVRKLREIIDL